MHYYDSKNIDHAKTLRKDMTPWERKLWYCFLKTYDPRFQRQKCIDHYIADFYCAKAQLIIELDGGGHYEERAEMWDQLRTNALERNGIQVIRICNRDIDRSFYEVCSLIDREVKKRLGCKK